MAGKGVHCAFFFFFSILFLILLAIFLFPCWMRGRGKCKGGGGRRRGWRLDGDYDGWMGGWMAGCKKFNIVYLAGQWVVGPVLGSSYPFVRVGCVVLGNIYFYIYIL